jgi:hypothetical protein
MTEEKHNWTVEELAYIADNYDSSSRNSTNEVAKALGLTYNQVRPKVVAIVSSRPAFTGEEIRYLFKNKHKPLQLQAEKLGRDYQAVKRLRKVAGLTVSNKWRGDELKAIEKTLQWSLEDAFNEVVKYAPEGVKRTKAGLDARRRRMRLDLGIPLPRGCKVTNVPSHYEPTLNNEQLKACRALGIG